jgi:enoyl-CoA hydratase/3-hydroxyacyl-CoA dehydrogenase
MGVEDIRKIAVIGAGDMGHGIAEIALLSGYMVSLRDTSTEFLEKGLMRLNDSLKKLVHKDIVSKEQYNMISKKLLHSTIELEEALEDSDLVIEAVPEILELKKDVFRDISRLSPDHSIMATNTSTMSVTEISLATSRPEKVVGLHFFNPVILMRLVEVTKGDYTSEETMQIACDTCNCFGKIPVRVEKDIPGFIVNRVQAPSGALFGAIVDHGIAQPEEIDALMRRLGKPMGPFELLDFTGIDVSYNARNYFAKAISTDLAPFQAMKEKVKAGHYGKKTGRGFYDWSKGRPEINLERATQDVDPKDVLAVMINESTKLIEWGVASAADIDRAIVNGTGNEKGPIEEAQGFDPEDLVARLERLSKQFKKKIFDPTRMIREGKYLRKGLDSRCTE